MTTTEEIRRMLDAGKLMIGLREAQRGLTAGSVSRVIVAANAPETERLSVQKAGEAAGVEIELHEARNDQLGTMCRKPFPIAFLSVKK